MSPLAPVGGRTPFIKQNAASGPARVLWALYSQAAPVTPWDVIPAVADASGEYPAKTGWNDFGLMADAPSYTHGRDTSGLAYQQSAGNLFEKISEITRSFTQQVGEINKDTLKIIENSAVTESVAAAVGKSAVDLVHTGIYSSLAQYRIAMLFYRPDGAGAVIEPSPSPVGSRPPLIMRVLPLVQLAAEDIDVEVSAEDPTNAEVQFTALPDTVLGAGKQYGYWAFENPGTIT